jgi:Flp pilus assembly protein TadB
MWCCDSAASDWVTREIAAARILAKPLTPIRLCAYPLRGAVSYFQAINLSKNLHHNCDCASKEAQAQKERKERAKASFPMMAAPPEKRGYPARLHSRTTALILALVVGLVVAGYFIYKLDYWRIAVGALLVLLLVGILSFALIVLLDRRTALRKRRVAKTIALIEDTLRSEAGAKK